MNTHRIYSVWQLANYLRGLRYHITYRKGTKDAYYNPRNGQIIFLPALRETLLNTEDIIRLFRESQAMDMPAEVEYFRFSQFIDLMYNH